MTDCLYLAQKTIPFVCGELIQENQFLNIGVGVHVKTIMAILDSKGVKYDMEGDDQGFRIVG